MKGDVKTNDADEKSKKKISDQLASVRYKSCKILMVTIYILRAL